MARSTPPSDAPTGDADLTPSEQGTPLASTALTSSTDSSSGSGSSATESDSDWDDTTTADGEEEDAGQWAPLQKLADEVRGYVESAHARWMVVSLLVHGAMWMSSILLTMAVSNRAAGMETRLLRHHGVCFAPHT